MATNEERDNKKNRINPRHVLLVMRNDKELKKLLQESPLQAMEFFRTSIVSPRRVSTREANNAHGSALREVSTRETSNVCGSAPRGVRMLTRVLHNLLHELVS